MKSNNQIIKAVSSACITDRDIIISYNDLDEVFDWLTSNGHFVLDFKGYVKFPNGEIRESDSFSFKPSQNDNQDYLDHSIFKESIEMLNNLFVNNPKNKGNQLFYSLHLSATIDIPEKLGVIIRTAAWLLGVSFVLLFGGLLLSIVFGSEVPMNEFGIFITGFLGGMTLIYTGYKGRGPLFLGDSDWFLKALLRYRIKDIKGKRKWNIINPN